MLKNYKLLLNLISLQQVPKILYLMLNIIRLISYLLLLGTCLFMYFQNTQKVFYRYY